MCLVTSGFRRRQESKIHALGISANFRESLVDDIEETPHIVKHGHLERLITKYRWAASSAWVAGDSPASELAAGRLIGATMVQTLRSGVLRSDSADHHVQNLDELLALLQRQC